MADVDLSPPSTVQGMQKLDKDKFTKDVIVQSICVDPGNVQTIVASIKRHLLKRDNLKIVADVESGLDKGKKIIYLKPDFNARDLTFREKEVLNEWQVDYLTPKESTVRLTYENWSANEIINAIVSGGPRFSGFTVVGKIVHVNLKDELLPYKTIIAEVLHDKLKNVKSVVNKIDSINSEYRNFQPEVLAGDTNLETIVKENGVQLELDFGKVFWNSRLGEEHKRIVDKLGKDDVLYDVFCGVGPFAIPAAKKGCLVLANDLNEDCITYLKRNIKLNKIFPKRLEVYNEDAASFIRNRVKEHMLSYQFTESTKIHITMNLPKDAVKFLSHFQDLFAENELLQFPSNSLPIVYMYCFVKGEKDKKAAEDAAVKSVKEVLRGNIEILEAFDVRNVAPNKEMIRVTFRLTREVLESQGQESRKRRSTDNNGEMQIKKSCQVNTEEGLRSNELMHVDI